MSFNKLTTGERRGMIVMLLTILAIVATLMFCSRKQNEIPLVNNIADSTYSAINNDTITQVNVKKRQKTKAKNKKQTKNNWKPRDPLAEPLPQHK